VSAATVDLVFRLLDEDGSAAYFGEALTITEHQLQTAHAAELAGAPRPLVVAALLHDVGWLLASSSPRQPSGPHEELGADWLSGLLPAAVTEPVRLHVLAKRYLCATRPEYHAALSESSRDTLVSQGGPLEPGSLKQFEEPGSAADAVRLRLWDDCAKVPGAPTPSLDHYRPVVVELSAKAN
jgi:gamma-butyrobetaine dioxygenase